MYDFSYPLFRRIARKSIYFWKSLGSKTADTRRPATSPQKGAPTFQIVICETVIMKQVSAPNRYFPLKASANALPRTENKASPASRLIKVAGRILLLMTTKGDRTPEISQSVPTTMPAT